MIGAAQTYWRAVALIFVGIAFYGTLGWLILRGYRWLKRSAESSLEQALNGLELYPGPESGSVVVVFHTYYGFLAFATQTEHRFWAPPEDAREALWRLHRFNLGWGMFAQGALLIPLLSYGNYLTQKRSIRRQEAELTA